MTVRWYPRPQARVGRESWLAFLDGLATADLAVTAELRAETTVDGIRLIAADGVQLDFTQPEWDAFLLSLIHI